MEQQTNSSPTRSAAAITPSKTQWLSTFVVRFAGYSVLLLTLVDSLALLIPPKFLDPAWELQTIGSLVDRTPGIIIGFALVAYGGRRYRQSLDKYCFGVMPTLAMVVGLCFLLMIPLGISNTLRLNESNQQQNSALAKQSSDLKNLEERLSNAPAPEVAAWAQKYNPEVAQGQNQDPAAIKASVITQLQASQAGLQAQATRSTRQPADTLRKTVKWLINALIAGLSLLFIGKTVGHFPHPKGR